MQGMGSTEFLSTSQIWAQKFRLPLTNRLPINTEISPTSKIWALVDQSSVFLVDQNSVFLVDDFSVKHDVQFFDFPSTIKVA